jgi:hypothetical protein
MYKATNEHHHFQEKTGSFSTHGSVRGYAEGGEPILILPTLKEQYWFLKEEKRNADAEVEQLRKTIADPTNGQSKIALREQLAKTESRRSDLIRQIGNWRGLVEETSQAAFERIFVNVAQARLPKDLFLEFSTEARTLWRAAGGAEGMPRPTQRQRRRLQKRVDKGAA